LFNSTSKSSAFALDFFHSLFGFGHRGDVGGVDPSADPDASSRDLFFRAPVFMLFTGDNFIFRMHRVFTRIRSGAFFWRQTAVVRVDLQIAVQRQCARVADTRLDLFQMAVTGGWKTLRVSASIYKSTGGAAMAKWICIDG
jgi:hypothetical protein